MSYNSESLLPADTLDTSDLQVRANIGLVAQILANPQCGIAYVHQKGRDTLMLVGVDRKNQVGGVVGTPYRYIWKPGKQTMADVAKIPLQEQEKRNELVGKRLPNDVQSVYAGWGGFLSSGLAAVPWLERLLSAVDSPQALGLAISYKGGEGTVAPSRGGDVYTIYSALAQVEGTIAHTGADLGFDRTTLREMVRGVWGHSYGGLLAFMHMTQYGYSYPNARYGLLTPLMMGANQPVATWPKWLQDASKDKALMRHHVHVLSDPGLSFLIKLLAYLPEGQIRRGVLRAGDITHISPALLSYYIGMDGYASQAVLPVYQQSLQDQAYTARDVRLLESAPYIADEKTIRMSSTPYAMVVGGRKKRQRDSTLASDHMLAFVASLPAELGSKPNLIYDATSQHHPRQQAIDRLVDWTLER